jgi:Matrixin
VRGVSLVVSLLVLTRIAVAGEPATFLGFRLLDLENQSVKWQSPHWGESAAVTYAFATEATTTKGARNCGELLPPETAYEPSHISQSQFRREVAAAFHMWEGAANISFRETSDPKTANIVIGAQGKPVGRAFTNVELKPAGADGRKVIARSMICLNPRQPWKIGFDGNLDVYDLRYTIAHEIGHAIGLDHPSAAGELMSYRYDERQSGLQAGDMKGAALLYGRPDGAPRFGGETTTGSTRAAVVKGGAGWPFGIGEDAAKARTGARSGR